MSSKLGTERRLHSGKQYDRIFSRGETTRRGGFVLFRLKNDQNHARIGTTVKTTRGAVFRNRVRRTVKEYFRQNQASLGDYDYNFVWRDPQNRPWFELRIVLQKSLPLLFNSVDWRPVTQRVLKK